MTHWKTQEGTWEGLLKRFLEGFEIPSIEDIKGLMQRVDRLEAMVKAMANKDNSEPVPPSAEEAALKPGDDPSRQAPALDRAPEGRAGKTGRGYAGEIVLRVIADHPKGTDFKTIRAATDFDDKKLRNIIFRLDKTGKIKRVKRGIYKKV